MRFALWPIEYSAFQLWEIVCQLNRWYRQIYPIYWTGRLTQLAFSDLGKLILLPSHEPCLPPVTRRRKINARTLFSYKRELNLSRSLRKKKITFDFFKGKHFYMALEGLRWMLNEYELTILLFYLTELGEVWIFHIFQNNR